MGKADAMVEAAVGYGLGGDGRGVAYVRLKRGASDETLRVSFTLSRAFRSTNREQVAPYAALIPVAHALRRRGMSSVRFIVSDERFADAVQTRSPVAHELALPYVRLRCELNAFSKCEIVVGETGDLTHRSRAEAALNLAA